MKKLLSIVLFMSTVLAHAGLYQCDSVDGEPKLETNVQKKNISFATTKPMIHAEAKNPEKHKNNLKPFLVYYVLDSEEPFMQISVKFELSKLKEACLQSANVQYAAIVNSLYVNKNEIIVCKDKNFQKVSLSRFPKLNSLLKAKREEISTGDHTSNDEGMMKYLVKYEEYTNEVFGKFPLAHPDFLSDFLKFIAEEKSLFPSDSYMPFLNLKSHGSNDHLLSGLYTCQTNAKIKSQTKTLERLLTEKELQLLNSPDYSEVDVSSIIEKLSLGNKLNVLADRMRMNAQLGNFELGNFELGNFELGNFELGADDGLGSDFSFGLSHSTFTHILRERYSRTNNQLGFVMLESCDTNRRPDIHEYFITNVYGIYSAQHSLWYRNLNWWTLLEEANGSTLRLIELLEVKTADIQNMIVE